VLHAELERLDMLTVVDTPLLSAYCQAYGFWKEASAMVNRLGMLTTTSNNNVIQNPFLAIVNKQAALMVKIASEFGFSPSSRSRLDVSQPEDDDALLALLSRRKV
jgi:P27 family predicted phage terminase small subunit